MRPQSDEYKGNLEPEDMEPSGAVKLARHEESEGMRARVDPLATTEVFPTLLEPTTLLERRNGHRGNDSSTRTTFPPRKLQENEVVLANAHAYSDWLAPDPCSEATR